MCVGIPAGSVIDDGKFVPGNEATGDRLAGRRCHGDFRRSGSGAATRGIEHALEQGQSLKTRRDSSQVTRGGMAFRTISRAVEIPLPVLAHCPSEDPHVHRAAAAAQRLSLCFLIVDERNDSSQFGIVESQSPAFPSQDARHEPMDRSCRRERPLPPAANG